MNNENAHWQYPANYPDPIPSQKKPRRWPWILGMVGTLAFGFVLGATAGSQGGFQTGYAAAMEDGVQGSQQSASQPYTPPAVAPAPMPSEPLVSEPAEILTGISNGVHQVGSDMEPGRYKTVGPESSAVLDMCYWSRSSDDSGELGSIIANDNIKGPSSVTVNAGEFVKFSGGCQWEKQ